MRRGRLSLDDYRACLDLPRVRLLAVSAVEFETGFSNDLAALGQMCAERNVFFFVDAIQSLGWTRIEPRRLGIHALAADGHKWLLGPEGAGIFWLSPDAPAAVEPTEVGWHSVADPLEFSRIRYELRTDAARFEPGSHAVVLLHGLGAALDLLWDVGMDRVRALALGLADRAREEIGRRGYELLSSDEPSERSPIVSFVPRRPPVELQVELAGRRIVTTARGRGLRLSPHFYNDEGDLEKFFAALDEAEGGKGGGREKRR
jgi:selenocysteine lyase/cysteine desulfurase